jgi:hypothetical protein
VIFDRIDIRLQAPERLGDASLVIFVARHHEQRVGQAVEVGEHGRADGLLAGERRGVAFGSAADVRATWSWAAPGDPPGSRKLVSGPTTSLSSSISARAPRCGALDGRDRVARLAACRGGEVRPRSKSWFWMAGSSRGQPLAQPDRERHADAAS